MLQTTTNKETTTWEEITPQKAQEYLAMNKNNRPLMSKVVDSYVKDLKEGKWIIGTSSVCFDVNGNLIDGQHRLSAIIKAGVTVRMEVKRNLSSDAFKAMDIGKPRQAKDMFNIAGIAYANQLSGIIRITLQYEKESYATIRYRLSNPEVWEIYSLISNEYDNAAKIANKYHDQYSDIPISIWGGTFLYLTLMKKHAEKTVLHFFDELSDKVSTENDTIRLFRKKLRNLKEFNHNVISSPSFHVILIKTWNAWITKNYKAKLPLTLKEGEEVWFILDSLFGAKI